MHRFHWKKKKYISVLLNKCCTEQKHTFFCDEHLAPKEQEQKRLQTKKQTSSTTYRRLLVQAVLGTPDENQRTS